MSYDPPMEKPPLWVRCVEWWITFLIDLVDRETRDTSIDKLLAAVEEERRPIQGSAWHACEPDDVVLARILKGAVEIPGTNTVILAMPPASAREARLLRAYIDSRSARSLPIVRTNAGGSRGVAN